MTRIYFVRHCEPDHSWEDDRTRPLTKEGIQDSNKLIEYFRDKKIDCFISSPYKRSYDTVYPTAQYYKKEIVTDERLRERISGSSGNNYELFQKRWTDKNYAEENGESIYSVQARNMAAIEEILEKYSDKNIVIGTHGTALSSILNFYNKSFNCDSFIRIINYMPYVIRFDFEGNERINQSEELIINKEYKNS